ncbi:MAG: RluA family pseudouridine synthase [Candidatus Omnitrophica bacterium]|nr:RluA family pseudouridine synthase [Candidatus Omnitrophota bacterium]MBU1038288.1 RluA family pseudouridine synthase [Candidatus Omnitrophota bacterium]
MEKKGFSRVEVTEADNGTRLDKFVTGKMGDKYSRVFLQRLITDGHILVDGIHRKNHYDVTPGEYIEIDIPPAKRCHIKAEKIPLNIVYEDSSVLVVNKTPDMVVHPAPGNHSGTLVNALLAHCKKLSGIGGVMKPGIVHRLDKGTSGLLVVAKTDQAHRFLARQFKDKTARRVYIAIVKGVVQFDSGVIDAPIGRDRRDRMKMVIDFESEKARAANTSYRVIRRFADSTMIELTLGTGRTHQVRIHMAYIGHPVLGDVKYGTRSGDLARPMLHAKTIGFIHPKKKKFIEFTSELPKDMKRLIASKKV